MISLLKSIQTDHKPLHEPVAACITVLMQIRPCVNCSNLLMRCSSPGMMEIVYLINEFAESARNKWTMLAIMR